jgi:uncharacterized RDD family membrane protein YckC
MERGPALPTLDVETPERVAVSLELAGLGARAFAWLTDAACIFLLWVTALLVYSIGGDLVREVQALSWAGQLLAVLLVFAAGWGWDVGWELLAGGRTPGKRVAGIRVVRADGGPPGLVESLLRNVLRAVELPRGYAPAILMVGLGARQQRLGDLVAGTLVVKQRRFDLSRYDLLEDAAAAAGRWPLLHGRAVAALGPEGYERVAGFLQRRPELDPAARARVAERLAAALAARAGVEPPAPEDAEAFLAALLAHAAQVASPESR